MGENIYETDKSISQYCDFHYGDEHFGVKNFAQNSVELLKPFFEEIETKKVLDLGCSVGRSSFELSNYFDKVVAIDYSHNFIEVAKELQNLNKINFDVTVEGDIYEKKISKFRRLRLTQK